jgi:hypothetical protein
VLPHQPVTEQNNTAFAPFGSDAHREWIARRLARNQRFREQVAEWSRRALDQYEAMRRLPA